MSAEDVLRKNLSFVSVRSPCSLTGWWENSLCSRAKWTQKQNSLLIYFHFCRCNYARTLLSKTQDMWTSTWVSVLLRNRSLNSTYSLLLLYQHYTAISIWSLSVSGSVNLKKKYQLKQHFHPNFPGFCVPTSQQGFISAQILLWAPNRSIQIPELCAATIICWDNTRIPWICHSGHWQPWTGNHFGVLQMFSAGPTSWCL